MGSGQHDAVGPASGRRSARRGGSIWTVVFGALAIVLAAAAVIVWVREANRPPIPSPPPAAAGHNTLINVLDGLRAEGFAVKSVPGGVPVGELRVPGQKLTVDGQTLYVFVYPNPAAAAADLGIANPAKVLGGAIGTPPPGGPPYVVGHSNVVVALVGGSDELRERVARAINALP
jgi:hypothetical protein